MRYVAVCLALMGTLDAHAEPTAITDVAVVDVAAGTVASGMTVVLDGATISAVGLPAVFLGGRYLDRDSLDTLLEQSAAMALEN